DALVWSRACVLHRARTRAGGLARCAIPAAAAERDALGHPGPELAAERARLVRASKASTSPLGLATTNGADLHRGSRMAISSRAPNNYLMSGTPESVRTCRFLSRWGRGYST